MAIRDIAVSLLILVGAFFFLVAAIGLIRLPDVYNRMHATTKAGTLGVTGFLLATVLYFGSQGQWSFRLVATIAFLWLTAPTGAHMLARAAYHVGHRPGVGTVRDDLREHVAESPEVE